MIAAGGKVVEPILWLGEPGDLPFTFVAKQQFIDVYRAGLHGQSWDFLLLRLCCAMATSHIAVIGACGVSDEAVFYCQ